MQKVYPTLRITDYEKSKGFYVDGLGFQIESEHRFAPHLLVRKSVGFPFFATYL
jgi:catechol 2,3-dioxygenase-like lactoylglutathione lyase family enzyme